MANDLLLFKEDGFLNLFCEPKNIIYHPILNVILVFNKRNEVQVLDVHSGTVLQTCILSDTATNVKGRYLQLQEKILIWDGKNLGLRSDYNGVLLLNTVLQAPVQNNDDTIKLELLLSEAVLFNQSLQNLEENGLECSSDVTNELIEKIKENRSNSKKGVKAQRWNVICLQLPHSSLKLVANNVVYDLRRSERYAPALTIASTINERLTDLLKGSRIIPDTGGNFERSLMYSEDARRQTFENWPHTDYKCLLPDQMAQAGFYHQPSVTGEDRAMCFTCDICLVCWEKTDEPWNEHERHSPNCPYIKGECTTNVPLSVTYATSPAVATNSFDVISNNDYSYILCTSNDATGEITIWSTERQLKIMHTLKFANYFKNNDDNMIATINQDGNNMIGNNKEVHVTALCALPHYQKPANNIKASSILNLKTKILGSKFIVGYTLSSVKESEDHIDENDQKKNDDKKSKTLTNNRTLYLQVFEIIDGDSGSYPLAEFQKISEISSQSIPGTAATSTTTTNPKGKKAGKYQMAKFNDCVNESGEVMSNDFVKFIYEDDEKDESLSNYNLQLAIENELTKIDDMTCKFMHDTEKLLFDDLKQKLLLKNYEEKFDTITKQLAILGTNKTSGNGGGSSTSSNGTVINKNAIKTTKDIDCIPISCAVPILNHITIKNFDFENYVIKEIFAVGKNQILVHLELIENETGNNKYYKNKTANDTDIDEMNELLMEIDEETRNYDDGNGSVLLIHKIDQIGHLHPAPSCYRIFTKENSPKEICVLPYIDESMTMYNKYDKMRVPYFNSFGGLLCIVCADGTLELLKVNTLGTIDKTSKRSDGQKFVSVTFCENLNRLAGITENGCLIFFSLNDPDLDSNDELSLSLDENSYMDVDGRFINYGDNNYSNSATNNQQRQDAQRQFLINTDDKPKNNEKSDSLRASPIPSSLLSQKSDLTINDLKLLHSLTLFDEEMIPYTAEVPSCWNELVQAQKQGRTPQRSIDDVNFSKTWRLHNDSTTWDEHIIEMNIGKPVGSLGHIDLKFSFYSQCPNPPAIEVTLLKHNTYGFGYRMKYATSANFFGTGSSSVDENIEFPLTSSGIEACDKNSYLSEEYLKKHKLEILAGPIKLSSCIDLCDQGGLVTLTSPKLFKTRARNLVLLIKTVTDSTKDGRGKVRVPIKKRGIMRCFFSSFSNNLSENLNNPIPSLPSYEKQPRNDYFVGCDWLHEISVSVRTAKENPKIPNERAQRIAMLESNYFLENLLKICGSSNTRLIQKYMALDILIWICTIRLMRYRSPLSINEILRRNFQNNSGDGNNDDCGCSVSGGGSNSNTSPDLPSSVDMAIQQKECVLVVEKYLENIILQCILSGNRKTANKCTKLILIVSEGVKNLPVSIKNKTNFDISLKKSIISCIPKMQIVKHSSSIRWFSLLINATSTSDSHQIISESCIKLLIDITTEIENRWDPYCSILSSRFGLYGNPFEISLFDIELPYWKTRNFNSTNPIIGIVKTNSTGVGYGSLFIKQNPIDSKKLNAIDSIEFRTFPHLIKAKSINNQIRGLLEVEPLHFTCFAASDSTRIETIDSSTTSTPASMTNNMNVEEVVLTPPQYNPDSILVHEGGKDKIIDLTNYEGNDIMNNVKNMIANEFHMGNYSFAAAVNDDSANADKLKPNGVVEHLQEAQINDASGKSSKYNSPKIKSICDYIESYDELKLYNELLSPTFNECQNNGNENEIIESFNALGASALSSSEKSSKTTTTATTKPSETTTTTAESTRKSSSSNEDSGQILPWHKLLVKPPKQMIVIERVNSGSRRFVVLDFGSPVILTDIIIPACDELSSLYIDIWCFDEETDSIRLAITQDIGSKTLVLSDLDPPPVCRFMKITIVARYGMSATRCKFPIGSFYGHYIALSDDIYSDDMLSFMKYSSTNITAQIKALNSLYEDVSCRHSLSCNKLIELLKPISKSDLSNVAHMYAYVNKQKDFLDPTTFNNNKIIALYEECTVLQHQMNVIKNVIDRFELSVNPNYNKIDSLTLESSSRDKLRVLSENVVEILLHLLTEHGLKNVFSLHHLFTMDVANHLFNTLVVSGDAYSQLSTCSLLVRMCCFQNWWGDFVANIFCNLFSSQNTKVFPQDRIFFLLTYLGRKSIAMGSCRSIIIDAILKTIAKLLAPISPKYNSSDNEMNDDSSTKNLWIKTDTQLITWLILFLSVCLDENNTGKKEKAPNRWEFMSCESDFTKSKQQSASGNSKNFPRCFKKRNIQQSKYNGLQPYTEWGKKIYMMQNESSLPNLKLYFLQSNCHYTNSYKSPYISKQLPEIFMELTGKTSKVKPTTSAGMATIYNKSPAFSTWKFASGAPVPITLPPTATTSSGASTTQEQPSNKDGGASSSSSASSTSSTSANITVNEISSLDSLNTGLKSIKLMNIVVVIRGLIAFILEMDFTCNMDLFLLTCKVVAKLVSACRPSIQLSKVITINQLEQLIRLAVWNDQQQPWAVHAITCLVQDLLDADKNYKETMEIDEKYTENSQMEDVVEAEEIMETVISSDNHDEITQVEKEMKSKIQNLQAIYNNMKDFSFADSLKCGDVIKYNQLPSLIECDDDEFDKIFNEPLVKKNSSNNSGTNSATSQHKNALNFYCKSISSVLDTRLTTGINTNIEIKLRHLTMLSSLDLYASLPQVPFNDVINTSAEQVSWPENIINVWSGTEYNTGLHTHQMFKNVFDNIFADLQLQDTWVHLQQVLQIWLTLNNEITDKSLHTNLCLNSMLKIPFGSNAIKGLLMALAWHNDINLRTWCLGFQCLVYACNLHSALDKNNDDLYHQKIGDLIVMDENFERMLIKFFSGHGINSSSSANRCVGPTICKHLHELIVWFQMKAEFSENCLNMKKKLKNTLLNVILQLTQPGGAIYNQRGPIDAQNQLICDLISFQYDKTDLTVAINIIDSVSFLVYNNIVNVENFQYLKLRDNFIHHNSSGIFSSVLLNDNTKQQSSNVTDNSLIINLLKLCNTLVQTELQQQQELSTLNIEMGNRSQTDEIKAEQLSNEQKKAGGSYIVDSIITNFPTMKRLLSSLSHCSGSSITTLYKRMYSDNNYGVTMNEPQTTADAVLNLLTILSEKASHPKLIVTPIYQYLKTSSTQHNVLPRILLSEPLLHYILRVLDKPNSISIFNDLGGIKIVCQNLVQNKKYLINMQPGLISMVMQHMSKNCGFNDILNQNRFTSSATTSSSVSAATATSANSKKLAQQATKTHDGLVNFAPFCTIMSENSTVQSAVSLLQTSISQHRRPRTPSWSYTFYPNESHVDLIVTLPTAILLNEIQLRPHVPNLSSCPSAIAIEISRDNHLGPIPIGQALPTAGMTFIRFQLSRPEIVTSIILRLYKPKDSQSIGLTQINILGTTIFKNSSNTSTNNALSSEHSLAKTSIGWIRILAKCFRVAANYNSDNNISKSIVESAITYPGFLESCCAILNIMPTAKMASLSTYYADMTIQNLEAILLKVGMYNNNVCLSLIKILLYDTTPQIYRLCNDAICDLLHDLCTKSDNFLLEKINVLVEWIIKLRENYENKFKSSQSSSSSSSSPLLSPSLRYGVNPHYGFIKCIASILWTVHSTNELNVPNSTDLINIELFNSCFYWINALNEKEPLKTAFDSLLCSLCYIKPELFSVLLNRVGVIQHLKVIIDNDTQDSTTTSLSPSEITNTPTSIQSGVTDDNKTECNSEWFKNVAVQNLKVLLTRPSYLDTLALVCQSPMAVYQLVDSGLPKMLSYAIYEFCSSMLSAAKNSNLLSGLSPSSLVNINQVPELLDFFAECCYEGYMRDWLGSYQGSIFWKPLLQLLSNYQLIEQLTIEPFQQAFIQIERSTINFFSKVTTCHQKNQETLTEILISVINEPKIQTQTHQSQDSLSSSSSSSTSSNSGSNNNNNCNKLIISGFTRRLVLQLLLESERILVSIRCKSPFEKSNHYDLSTMNNHPSMRISKSHLLFYLSTNTTCEEIIQNCVPANTAFLNLNNSSMNNRQIFDSMPRATSSPNIFNDVATLDDSDKEYLDVGIHNMEFISVAAGVTAKDKRLKDVKNHAAALKKTSPKVRRSSNKEDSFELSLLDFVQPDCPDVILTGDTTISQILAMLCSRGHSLSTPCLRLSLDFKKNSFDNTEESHIKCNTFEPLTSPLQKFSSRGGLLLLAHYLPTVYLDYTKAGNYMSTGSTTIQTDKEKSPPMSDWVKIDANDDVIYEDLEETIIETSSKIQTITSVPQHSLAAFGLFLRLPAYSDVLLRDKIKAQCLLRLVLGVTGDGEGNDIYSLSIASSLPTLPFEVFRQLLDSSPLTTDDGILLRRITIDVGAMHLILNCLSVFTHQSQNYQLSGGPQSETNGSKGSSTKNDRTLSDDKSHIYWAKGTGFGTGSTQKSWDVEQALLRQKSEEEHVTILLQVLSSYINPGDNVPAQIKQDTNDTTLSYHENNIGNGELPSIFPNLLQESCLVPALSSYLRNDSVLDITRHIPLYRSILQLLRAISISKQLVNLLKPNQNSNGNDVISISSLLSNMKRCVDTYAKRLKVNKKSNIKGQTQKVTVNIDDGDDEGLARLIPDIQETADLVHKATYKASDVSGSSSSNMQMSNAKDVADHCSVDIERSSLSMNISIEEKYLEVMKCLQFDTFEMITECENGGFKFVISHHFENNVRMAGDRGHPSRVKRLAQETVTISTSLPLSYSSSVFVRCDTDRLDIMKVLITGPADTPYANGCFEFDVYFPPDYPISPMLINLETTGRHSVRFNPNLYNDGKVCLSVLNTWHGRPEEKWNAQTSSFLQVLVSIQSLILVPEPYFNEPGFERSRGTPSGTHSSKEYNSNIYQACVRWAMLEQIKNPNPCFKDVIHTHFWLKKHEICAQVENWIEELNKPHCNEKSGRTISFNAMVLRRQYRQLREELAKLKPPSGLEDFKLPPLSPFSTTLDPPPPPPSTTTAAASSEITTSTSTASSSSSSSSTTTDGNTSTVILPLSSAPNSCSSSAATPITPLPEVSIASVYLSDSTQDQLSAESPHNNQMNLINSSSNNNDNNDHNLNSKIQ